jgi:tetratricopeptide (TPR) repeat protein
MLKKIILTLLMTFFVSGAIVYAQAEEELPSPGLTPDNPFYFLKIFIEDIGTFFTFSDIAKAERYTYLAQKRIAEAKAMIDKGKPEKVEKALERYQSQLEKALARLERAREEAEEERQERINQVLERVAQATSKHFAVLDEVLEKVPEQAREAILKAKEVSVTGQKNALRVLIKEKPEKAVEIFSKALEQRLNRVREGVDSGDIEEAEEAAEEYDEYAAFGQEISDLAKGIRTGETTVEELVKKATSHHLDVLENVLEKAPEQARPAIEKVIEASEEIRQRQFFKGDEEGEGKKLEEGKPQTESPSGAGESKKIEESEKPGVCIQVITPAKNPQTGECKEFSTPCEVPKGWTKVRKCENKGLWNN